MSSAPPERTPHSPDPTPRRAASWLRSPAVRWMVVIDILLAGAVTYAALSSERGVLIALVAACVCLVCWQVAVFLRARRGALALGIERNIRLPHYLQAGVQGCHYVSGALLPRGPGASPAHSDPDRGLLRDGDAPAVVQRQELAGRLRPLAGGGEHQPLPVVRAGVLLRPAPAGRGRPGLQGVRALAPDIGRSSTFSIRRR